jgi:hypothetical protein
MLIEQAADVDVFSHHETGLIRAGIMIGGRSTGEMRLFVGDAAASVNNQSAAGFLVRGVWQHYGLTWDGATVRFYRNGVLHSSSALSNTPTTGGTRYTSVGFNTSNNPGRYFDIRYFPNTLLTASDVRASMDPRRTVAGCKGRWFRNWYLLPGTNTLIADESGFGNNLTSYSTGAAAQTIDAPPYVSTIASTQRRTRHLRGVRSPAGSSTSVLPGVGALTLTGLAPTVALPVLGALTITGLSPTILTPRVVLPGVGVLTLTGIAATVTSGPLVAMVTPPLTALFTSSSRTATLTSLALTATFTASRTTATFQSPRTATFP